VSSHSERRRKLLSMAEGRNVVVATPENLFYVSDFFGSGVGVVRPDKTLIVTTPLEEERVNSTGVEVEVICAAGNRATWETVSKNLERGGCYIDDDSRVRGSKRFMKNEELFLAARRVKDSEEIRRIEKASEILDEIFTMLERELKRGRTEREVAGEVVKTALVAGATTSGFGGSLSPTILASGENGAFPHSELTDRRISEGDFVISDLTFRYRGYCSDATRTFAVGRVSGEMKRNYSAVLEAQEYGAGLAKEGAVCGDIHEGVVSRLKKHSLERYFVHGTGHGVGIQVHEAPSIGRRSKTRLAKGDVITVEPGVYFPGKYGIRIEDTLLVRDNARPLNRYRKEMVAV
jgi:Xaa-Pro aminopeptidase